MTGNFVLPRDLGSDPPLTMTQFFLWYLLVSALGWLTFPLTFRLFPALADRGFSLARTFGVLVWGYAFWMMASLGIVQNDGRRVAAWDWWFWRVVSGSVLFHKETRKSIEDGSGRHGD